MIALRYRLLSFAARFGIAFRYATRQMTQDDARELYYPVTELAGWRPLITLEDEDIVSELRERFQDDPRFEDWADHAGARVARKWTDDGESRFAAIDWAVNLVKEYADQDGVPLVELTDDEIEAGETAHA